VIYETPHANCVHSFMTFNDAFSLSVYAALNIGVITKLWSGEDLEQGTCLSVGLIPVLACGNKEIRNSQSGQHIYGKRWAMWSPCSQSCSSEHLSCTYKSTRRIATYMVMEKEYPNTWTTVRVAW